MTIDNFDVMRVSSSPLKTDAPLTIDWDTVLSFPVAVQRFEPVAGRNQQVLEPDRRIDNP
jgi:hypothetical protein